MDSQTAFSPAFVMDIGGLLRFNAQREAGKCVRGSMFHVKG